MSNEVISTTGLTKAYGGRNVVDGLELRVPTGCVYGFMGLNGAGKSTTMKMLLGLAKPTSGSIEVFGKPLRANLPEILAQTGSLIEGPSYYPHLTGQENLAILQRMLGLDANRIGRVLRTVGLQDAAGKLARAYSLGMKQRLGIAMALLAEPRLLILDEPTNGLDPAGIHEIRQLLVRLAHERGVSVLVSTHLLAEIDLMADQVGIIHEGVLRYQGNIAGLRDTGRLVVRTSDNPRALAELIRIGCPASSPTGQTIEVPGDPGDANCALIARTLHDAGLDLYSMSQQRRSLEDVFLDLTAQTLDGIAGAAQPTPGRRGTAGRARRGLPASIAHLPNRLERTAA